jgi:hypothetical protein
VDADSSVGRHVRSAINTWFLSTENFRPDVPENAIRDAVQKEDYSINCASFDPLNLLVRKMSGDLLRVAYIPEDFPFAIKPPTPST